MTNNENRNNLKLNKYGKVDAGISYDNWYLSLATNKNIRRIRTECGGAVEAIMADYDPLNGLGYLIPPSKPTKVSENLEFASGVSDGITFAEAIKIAKEVEEQNEAVKLEYKKEILARKGIINKYKLLIDDLMSAVEDGRYKRALSLTKELKGSYRTEVRAVIISAAKAEAPYRAKVDAERKVAEEKAAAREKIREGVRTLLNL